MKRFLGFLAVVAFLGLGGNALAMDDSSSFLSGREWSRQMTPKEKMMSLLPPMALYNKFGVHFEHTVFEYIDTLDSQLESNPVLGAEDIANILASAIYEHEPNNRLALERMSAVFEILKKREDKDLYPSIPVSEE